MSYFCYFATLRKWWRVKSWFSHLMQQRKLDLVSFRGIQRTSPKLNGLSFPTASYFTTVRLFFWISNVSFDEVLIIKGLLEAPIWHEEPSNLLSDHILVITHQLLAQNILKSQYCSYLPMTLFSILTCINKNI